MERPSLDTTDPSPGSGPRRHPRCESCGRDATGEAVLHGLRLCGRCQRRNRLAAQAWGYLATATILAIVFYALPRSTGVPLSGPLPIPDLGWVVFGPQFIAFYIALVFVAIPNTLAQALGTRILGVHLREVKLGAGKTLARGEIGNVKFVLHANPMGGGVRFDPTGPAITRARRIPVLCVGPLAALALAGICWAARSLAPNVLVPVALANLFLFVITIVPCPPTATQQRNGGWRILEYLRDSSLIRVHTRRLELMQRYDTLMLADSPSEAEAFLRADIERAGGDEPDAETILCIHLLASTRTAQQIDEGLARSERLLPDDRVLPQLRAILLNNRAYLLAVRGDGQHMAEAEQAVNEALRHDPKNASFRGTRALVLARVSRFAEAESAAEAVIEERVRALSRADEKKRKGLTRSLAANRCTLALVYAHTGRSEAAEREASAAAELDSSCILLPELRAAA